MTEPDIRSFLVIGIDVVSLATSAREAGYRVCAVDYFGDQDLKRICHESLSIVKQTPGVTCGQLSANFNPEDFLQLTERLLEENQVDATLLSTGLDDSPDVLFELNDLIPILGNHPNAIERIRNKMEFFQELKCLGIPHPKTAMAQNFKEARKKAKDIGYPVLVKPSRGFAGTGIRKAHVPKEIEQAFHDAFLVDEKVLIQEHISGTPASVSLISSTSKAVALTLNEQLLGVSEVNQKEPFGYCGNVVPFVERRVIMERCESIAEKITSNFGLVGSNGVDLVISEEGIPYVIEVNPRFQGTLECIERVLEINMVEAHVNTCLQRRLPTIVRKNTTFYTRLILFAPRRLVAPDLNAFAEVRDVPLPKVVIEKGEPVCSVVVEGANRESSLREAMAMADQISESSQLLR